MTETPIVTEKATQVEDLPHKALGDGPACAHPGCGRDLADALHEVPATPERAAELGNLITEKGS